MLNDNSAAKKEEIGGDQGCCIGLEEAFDGSW
jgi:hypothetical protein